MEDDGKRNVRHAWEERVLLAVMDGTRNMYLNVEGQSRLQLQGTRE